MVKPRLIILVRHAQSEGNKNRDVHQTIPDHRVKLTQEGWAQARDAGRRLRKMLRPDDTLHFFTSPYRRTRETTEGILSTLTTDDTAENPDGDRPRNGHGSSSSSSLRSAANGNRHHRHGDAVEAGVEGGAEDAEPPSPFLRSKIKVYEEPRLREQDFGNFQPCSAEMERMWQERADYGHFFYRIPNGESAADAYDRVSGFNESLWRQFGEDDFASVCVLVTHGLMARVFLMKWYHFTVERFEDLRNINHCEFLIMRQQENGKYLLENQLRTWSELRRERAHKEVKENKDKVDKDHGKDKDKDTTRLERTKSFALPRRWGGCPNGCNHSRHYKRRDDLEVLRQKDADHCGTETSGSVKGGGGGGPALPHSTSTSTAAGSTNGAGKRSTRSRPSTINSDQAPKAEDLEKELEKTKKEQEAAEAGKLNEQDDGAKTGSDVDVIRTTTTTITTITKKGSSSSSGPARIAIDSPDDFPLSSPDFEDGGPLHNVMSTEDEGDSNRNSIRNGHHLHVHVGRDGGGTYSGHASTAGSESEDVSEDDPHHSHHLHDHKQHYRQQHHRHLASITARLGLTKGKSSKSGGSSRLGRGKPVNHQDYDDDAADSSESNTRRPVPRLGDAPTGSDGESDGDGDAEHEDDDPVPEYQREEQSIRESVY